MRKQQSNDVINAEELFLIRECFLTGTAVLTKHRVRAARYVARDSKVTSRVRNWRLKGAGRGRVGKDSSELMVSHTVIAHFRTLTGKCMGALQYAKLTGHRSVGIPDENGTTLYPRK